MLICLPAIRTFEEKTDFIGKLNLWLTMYGRKIDQLPKNDKIYSDLQRTKSLLVHASEHIFHYLENPLIPFSTNRLEGLFARMKENYRRHRGLRVQNRERYFIWYAYFHNSKNSYFTN